MRYFVIDERSWLYRDRGWVGYRYLSEGKKRIHVRWHHRDGHTESSYYERFELRGMSRVVTEVSKEEFAAYLL